MVQKISWNRMNFRVVLGLPEIFLKHTLLNIAISVVPTVLYLGGQNGLVRTAL